MGRISLRKEGRRFLIAVVLIGFASLNTGNNLIYLIFSLMLSITLVTFVLSAVNLRGLMVRLSFKEPVYAGTPFSMDVIVENTKSIPSYSVSIMLPFTDTPRVYLPYIKKGLNRMRFSEMVLKKRGRYHISELRLMTGFPFIFMHLYKRAGHDTEVIVYPGIIDVGPLITDILPSASESGRPRIEHEGEYLFAREYIYGEESRRIDWKATARTQKTMVKVFSRGDERLATVLLDNSGRGRGDIFERAVSVAASLCAEFIQRGYFVRLITCKKVVPFGRGRSHLLKILDILAVIEQVEMGRCPVEELSEGLSMAVVCSDSSGLSGVISQCSGVIDARDL